MADHRLHAVPDDVQHDGFLGVDAHPAQEVVAEGIHPQNLVRSDERRPGPGLGHDLGDQGIAFHPLVREYDFPAELGNPVQQLVGSGRRSALEHTENVEAGAPTVLPRLVIPPAFSAFLFSHSMAFS